MIKSANKENKTVSFEGYLNDSNNSTIIRDYKYIANESPLLVNNTLINNKSVSYHIIDDNEETRDFNSSYDEYINSTGIYAKKHNPFLFNMNNIDWLGLKFYDDEIIDGDEIFIDSINNAIDFFNYLLGFPLKNAEQGDKGKTGKTGNKGLDGKNNYLGDKFNLTENDHYDVSEGINNININSLTDLKTDVVNEGTDNETVGLWFKLDENGHFVKYSTDNGTTWSNVCGTLGSVSNLDPFSF